MGPLPPASARAVELLQTQLDRFEALLVDLLENPQLARQDEIVAIPTLVRKLPDPIRKVIGDMSDAERTLVGLQLRPGPR